MEWKDLLDIASLNYFDDNADKDVDTEHRQQVQKTLFNNIMNTKTPQEKKETKKRMMYKTCGGWRTREDKQCIS